MNANDQTMLDSLTTELEKEAKRHSAAARSAAVLSSDTTNKPDWIKHHQSQAYLTGQAAGIRRAIVLLQRKYVELCNR